MIGDWYRALNGRWRRKFYLPCFVLYFPDQKKTKIYSDYVTLSEVPLRPIGRVDTYWESFLGKRFMIAFCSLWRVEHFSLMPQLTLDLLAIPKSQYISLVIEWLNEFKSIKNIQSASNINNEHSYDGFYVIFSARSIFNRRLLWFSTDLTCTIYQITWLRALGTWFMHLPPCLLFMQLHFYEREKKNSSTGLVLLFMGQGANWCNWNKLEVLLQLRVLPAIKSIKI